MNLINQQELLRAFNNQFLKGTSTLIIGPSGCGKSTLFQTISGHWPFTDKTLIHLLSLVHLSHLQSKLSDYSCYISSSCHTLKLFLRKVAGYI